MFFLIMKENWTKKWNKTETSLSLKKVPFEPYFPLSNPTNTKPFLISLKFNIFSGQNQNELPSKLLMQIETWKENWIGNVPKTKWKEREKLAQVFRDFSSERFPSFHSEQQEQQR